MIPKALLAILAGLFLTGACTANSSPVRTAIEAAVADADVSGCPQALPTRLAAMPRRAKRGCPRSRDTHGLSEALRRVYVRSGGNPLWIDSRGLTPHALALLARLRAADVYGLRPEDYMSPALAKITDRSSIDASAGTGQDASAGTGQTVRRAQSDVALSAAALRFVSDLH